MYRGRWRPLHCGGEAIALSNIRKLKTPIAAKGTIGFWRLPLDLEKQVWDDLGEPMPTVRG